MQSGAVAGAASHFVSAAPPGQRSAVVIGLVRVGLGAPDQVIVPLRAVFHYLASLHATPIRAGMCG